MSVDGSKKLLNQSAFAKACGVSISTIRNRVESGKIIPAQSVGGKDYFTEDQIISMQLAVLRSSVTQSFLGLIFEDDDIAYAEAESVFVSEVKRICPSAHSIKSLAESMQAMGVGAKFELTESTTPVYRGKVIDKFLQSVRGMVNACISSVYLEEPLSRVYSYQFFLDVFCEDDDHKADVNLVNSYNSCGITNIKYILSTLKASVIAQFTNLKRKYGLFNCCENCHFTLRDALTCDGRVLLNDKTPIVHDVHATGAKTVFDALEKETKGSLVKSGISTVYQEGFYTVIRVKEGVSDEELASIISIVTSGDYKSISINSREKAPKLLTSVVDSLLKNNVLKVMG